MSGSTLGVCSVRIHRHPLNQQHWEESESGGNYPLPRIDLRPNYEVPGIQNHPCEVLFGSVVHLVGWVPRPVHSPGASCELFLTSCC